jgi:hypothetical protein
LAPSLPDKKDIVHNNLSPSIMDSTTPNLNTSDFNEKDKKDLQTFIENEHSKAKFQSSTLCPSLRSRRGYG